MNWGYRKPLEAIVVPLNVRTDSQLAYHHIVDTDEMGRPTIVKKQSLPLGIPLAAMEDMQDEYCSLIEDIAKNDLDSYVSVAYWPVRDLPGRLLETISNFYRASLAAGEEVIDPRPISKHQTLANELLVRNASSNHRDSHNLNNHTTKSCTR